MPTSKPTRKYAFIIVTAAVIVLGAISIFGGSLWPSSDRDARAAGGVMAAGWMSGWSTDADLDRDGDGIPNEIYVDVNPSGPGWVSLAGTTQSGTGYGLEFVETNSGAQAGEERGYLQGYAWTPTLGWISFQAADVVGCPEAPCEPKPKLFSQGGSDYIFRGWARILSIRTADEIPVPGGGFVSNSGGYKGWIRLSSPSGAACPPVGTPPGPTGCPYGVKVSNGTFPQNDAYAWSNEFGWLRFQGTLSVGSALTPACTIGANPGQRRISRATPTATSSLSWGCADVIAGTCELSWDKASTTVTGISNGDTVPERVSGVITRFSTSTIYTVQCDSAIPGEPKASANASINVIYPSGIIEVPGF